MSWSWRPERAPECMNGRVKCQEFWCLNTLKRPGYCLSCRKKQKERQSIEEQLKAQRPQTSTPDPTVG